MRGQQSVQSRQERAGVGRLEARIAEAVEQPPRGRQVPAQGAAERILDVEVQHHQPHVADLRHRRVDDIDEAPIDGIQRLDVNMQVRLQDPLEEDLDPPGAEHSEEVALGEVLQFELVGRGLQPQGCSAAMRHRSHAGNLGGPPRRGRSTPDRRR